MLVITPDRGFVAARRNLESRFPFTVQKAALAEFNAVIEHVEDTAEQVIRQQLFPGASRPYTPRYAKLKASSFPGTAGKRLLLAGRTGSEYASSWGATIGAQKGGKWTWHMSPSQKVKAFRWSSKKGKLVSKGRSKLSMFALGALLEAGGFLHDAAVIAAAEQAINRDAYKVERRLFRLAEHAISMF